MFKGDVKRFGSFLHRHLQRWRPRRRGARWEASWSKPDFSPPWSNRGVAREIIDAVEDGFLPPSGRVLDVGCGLGEIAAWFAERGYEASGIDIAPAAIARARKTHAGMPARLRFEALDICTARPSGGPFDVLVDRGCLHGIHGDGVEAYVENLRSCSSPGVRMILLMRAFRKERPFDDTGEKRELTDYVSEIFGGWMVVVSAESTYLDRDRGKNPDNVLPGMCFRLASASVRSRSG